MTRHTGHVFAAALLLLTAHWGLAQESSRDTRFAGVYDLVGGEHNGTAMPAEKIQHHVARFTADRIIVTDRDKKEVYVATYKVDTRRTPWTLMMTSEVPMKGTSVRGLIELKGDTLRLIYALPGGEIPRSFKTQDKQNLVVLKRRDR